MIIFSNFFSFFFFFIKNKHTQGLQVKRAVPNLTNRQTKIFHDCLAMCYDKND